MTSDFHWPMSLTTIRSTSARSSAMALPARRARALMSACVRPKEAPITAAGAYRRTRVRWLKVRLVQRPAGKKDGEQR
jgi:hypothetical protein